MCRWIRSDKRIFLGSKKRVKNKFILNFFFSLSRFFHAYFHPIALASASATPIAWQLNTEKSMSNRWSSIGKTLCRLTHAMAIRRRRKCHLGSVHYDLPIWYFSYPSRSTSSIVWFGFAQFNGPKNVSFVDATHTLAYIQIGWPKFDLN